MNNEISNYCQNHLIPKDLSKRILAIAEELGVQMLLPLLPNDSKASLNLEFSDDLSNAILTIKYSGIEINPLGSNDLALIIAQNLSKPISYRYDENAKENTLTAIINTK